MKTKFTIFFVLICGILMAQQDAQYTQYMYNTVNINPAYAGSKGVLSIFALHRTQWVGLEGAPKTNTVSVNTPINDSKLGLGVSFTNDQIGPTTDNTLAVDLSYTIPVSESYSLSFGLKAAAQLFNLDATKLNPKDQNDIQNIDNEFSPNIGAGLYLHSDNGYLGLSVPHFLQNTNYNANEIAIYKQQINYYLIGGYVFDLNPDLKFKPAFMTKLVQGAPLQVDLSANLLFNEKFNFGLAYRWSAAVSAMAGFQITESILIGYAYDFDTTSLGNYNSGSHEIFLRFEIKRKNKRIITPRFF